MTIQRRNFAPSFKLEAVHMITEQGLNISHVSWTVEIGVTAIRRWMKQHEAEQQGQPGIGKPLTAKQQRILHWCRKTVSFVVFSVGRRSKRGRGKQHRCGSGQGEALGGPAPGLPILA